MNTSSLIDLVTDRFPEAVSSSHTYRGDETVVLRQSVGMTVAPAFIGMGAPLMSTPLAATPLNEIRHRQVL